jgi:serine/threonine protein kinase
MALSEECLDEQAIADLLADSGRDERLASLAGHLDRCGECRRLVGFLGAERDEALGSVTELDLRPAGNKNAFALEGKLLAGRFLLGALLGRGGMGVVYEAEDRQLHTRVALKLLLPEVERLTELLEQMRRESLVGRRITHPNVCRVYDFGHHQEAGESFYFITMELVVGRTLESMLAESPLPPDEVVRIFEQICEALEAAHAQGVVHRDLKPGNVMLDEQGSVKVLDFGLARDLSAERALFARPVGTPAFWSPEQSRGEPATQASDLYALGRTALRLFGGRPPAGGVPPLDVVPTRYRKLVAQCLEPIATARPRSARDLRLAWVRASHARNLPPVAWAAIALWLIGVGALSHHFATPAEPPPPATLSARECDAERDRLAALAHTRFLSLSTLQRVDEDLRQAEWARRADKLAEATQRLASAADLLEHP